MVPFSVVGQGSTMVLGSPGDMQEPDMLTLLNKILIILDLPFSYNLLSCKKNVGSKTTSPICGIYNGQKSVFSYVHI